MSNAKSMVARGTFAALMLALSATPALATMITVPVTTSGSSGGSAVSGSATFVFSATSFTVTLNNTSSPTSMTAQELDGLTFDLSGGSGSPSLVAVAAPQIVDCAGVTGTSCPAFTGTVPADNGWGASTSGSGLTTLTPVPLGFHPYAIINSDYSVSNGGNLGNAQHNPFMVGPVVFTFSGSFTDVSNVTFDWGTTPATTIGHVGMSTGPVPEPGSIVFLGTGLFGVALLVRRRFLV